MITKLYLRVNQNTAKGESNKLPLEKSRKFSRQLAGAFAAKNSLFSAKEAQDVYLKNRSKLTDNEGVRRGR